VFDVSFNVVEDCAPVAVPASSPACMLTFFVASWTLVHPPIGPMMPSYHRRQLASYHRPFAWYRVPFLNTPGAIFSGTNCSRLGMLQLEVVVVLERRPVAAPHDVDLQQRGLGLHVLRERDEGGGVLPVERVRPQVDRGRQQPPIADHVLRGPRVPQRRVVRANRLHLFSVRPSALHDLEIAPGPERCNQRHQIRMASGQPASPVYCRSEEHTSELQSRGHLVCRLLLEK